MKNKSKLSKIKENKNNKVKLPEGWLLMCKKSYSVQNLAELLKNDYNVEVWNEAEVLEIILEEKSSMDIEAIDTDLGY